MKFNRLLCDELLYELQIRGIPPATTLDGNRQLLRDSLKKNDPVKNKFLPQDIAAELHICEFKLDNLCEEIINFDTNNQRNEFERISTRLAHVTNRLRRISCDDTFKDGKERQLQRCQLLSEDLQRATQMQVLVVESRRAASIMDLPNELPP